MYVEKNVSRCRTRGEFQESVACMPLPSMNKAAHSGFETHTRVSREVQNGGISGPTERTYVLEKLKEKTGVVF